MSLSKIIDGPLGYNADLALEPEDLKLIKSLIKEQWLEQIRKISVENVSKFSEAGIERYHEYSHLIPHVSCWPKATRTLEKSAAEKIRGTSLIKRLESEFGPFEISDEDENGWEAFTWRLVRPNEPTDIGPLHADEWFVVVGNESMPPGRRIKVWIAIVCESGRNGLMVVPGSHLKKWDYHGETRDGKIKPVFDGDEKELVGPLIPTDEGAAIVFHHDLIHGGVLNKGSTMRISLEFTFCVKN